jgi:hypothetical protein
VVSSDNINEEETSEAQKTGQPTNDVGREIDEPAGDSENVGKCYSNSFYHLFSFFFAPATAGARTGTTATIVGSDSLSTDLDAYADAWFFPLAIFFQEISADPTWRALVSEWVRFEALSPPDGVRF